MASRSIIVMPDPILREKVPYSSVEKSNIPTLASVIRDMWDTIRDVGEGIVGLAANQIGYNERIIVIKKGSLTMINPILLSYKKKSPSWEGCFSLPGYYALVPRYKDIAVSFFKLNGTSVLKTITDPSVAVVIQHELDHLNGILISDYVEKKNGKSGGILTSKVDTSSITYKSYINQ